MIVPAKNITDLTTIACIGPSPRSCILGRWSCKLDQMETLEGAYYCIQLSVQDNNADETYSDPAALRDGIMKHSISLTIAYKHCNGQGTEAGIQEGTNIGIWPDTRHSQRLAEIWLDHHRRKGTFTSSTMGTTQAFQL